MPPNPDSILAILAANRWISPVTGAIAAAVSTADGVTIGPEHFGSGAAMTVEDDLLCIRRGWRLETYRRYRPLVYYAAFGADDVFACLRLAVTSLFEFGAYDGDVLILTDPAHQAWADCLPEPWRPRIQMRAVEAADVLGWTLARYRVADMAELRCYRPLLYLDADVVCNAPIQPVLQQLAFSAVLCAPGEHALLRPEDWYGASLFAADHATLASQLAGFSTGVLGIPDLAKVKPLFRAVPALAEAFATENGTRDRFDCYDQPFANYAVVKGGIACDLSLLGHFLDNQHFWHPRAEQRKGLAHFTGGTGVAAKKLEAMAAYVDQLRAIPP